MRLRNLILLVVLPLVVAPIVLLGSLGYVALRDRTEEAVQNQVNTLLDQVALFLDAKLRAVQADARVLASSGLVERYILSVDELDRYELFQPSLLKMFGEQQEVNPDYFEIRILLPDGYEDARATVERVPNLTEEEGGSEFFQALAAAPADTFSSFELNPDNAWPVLLVSRRLRLKDRSVDPLSTEAQVRGYLIITARLATLESQVRTNRIGAEGILLFTDRQGRILVHPDPMRVGEQLPAALFSDVLASKDIAQLKRLSGAGDNLLWQARELHEDLYAIVNFPEQELVMAGRRLGLSVLAITFAAVLVTAMSLFWLLERTVNAPIQQLSRAVREIGKGNLEPVVDLSGAREIMDLTRAFQAMGRDLRNSDEQIRFLAFHDPITGLPNRKMFIEYLDKALEKADLRGTTIAVLLLNLDHFGQINEALGRAAGDELLKEIAGRLSRNLHSEGFSAVAGPGKASDLLAHMGGDEFALVLTDIGSALDAGIFARRLLEDLARPSELKGTKVSVTASLAITIFLDDGQDAATLLRHAHIAMYRAKDRGKNNYQYYSESLNTMVATHFEMEQRLRDALAHERLGLFFQPVVDRENRRIVALQALLHWDDPDLQAIPPKKLIEIAEKSDLIHAIGDWVLEQACRWGTSWQDKGLPYVSISVKVFERQVNRGDLKETVRQALKTTSLPAHSLNLQITESCVLAAREGAIDLLSDVRTSGVQISIDNVGTGYSSLNYLRQLPIDSLKIDRSFLEHMATDTHDSVIIDAIIAMGHSLGLQVIAEGVETPEQLRFLEGKTCDLFQGSLLGRPLPAEEVPQLLSRAPT